VAQLHGATDAAALKQVLAELALEGEPGPGLAVRGREAVMLWIGPGQYLLVSPTRSGEALSAWLGSALAPLGAVVVDLSHARAVLRLEGAAVCDVLAKGCPLDVERLEAGSCAPTLVSHFNVLLHCVGEGVVDVYVSRSFAAAFGEWVLRAGAEFGIDIR
jgi:sarcosine oxidase subunit gamma